MNKNVPEPGHSFYTTAVSHWRELDLFVRTARANAFVVFTLTRVIG